MPELGVIEGCETPPSADVRASPDVVRAEAIEYGDKQLDGKLVDPGSGVKSHCMVGYDAEYSL